MTISTSNLKPNHIYQITMNDGTVHRGEYKKQDKDWVTIWQHSQDYTVQKSQISTIKDEGALNYNPVKEPERREV